MYHFVRACNRKGYNMKVTFLTPPPLDGKPAAERIFGCNYGIYPTPNIFILTLAAILKEINIEAKLLDFTANQNAINDFVDAISCDDSDIYVFYTVFLSKKTDILAREKIRELRPTAKYIYLSTEPTASPDDFIAADTVVVRGEPDDTLSELVPLFISGGSLSEVLGISYKNESGIVHNPPRPVIENLDRLPFPDRSLIDPSKFHNPKLSRLPYTALMASRGCSYRCYYCVPNSLDFAREIEFKGNNDGNHKPPVRVRSASSVLKEVAEIKAQGYKSFFILDDQFPWDERRTLEIMDGLKGLDMEWCCLARANHLLNENIVKAMAEAGCAFIAIGVESFNQEILDYIKKDIKVEMIYKAVANLKKYGIEPELNILIGSCPLETEQTINHTVQEAIKLDVDYVLISVCTPFPHTDFNKIAKQNGWMIEPEYRAIDPIKQSFISYPHLPKADLERIIRRSYINFYYRPSYIWKRIRKLNGLSDLFNKAKAAISILRD